MRMFLQTGYRMWNLKNWIQAVGQFTLAMIITSAAFAQPADIPQPRRVIKAQVVALEQVLFLNRLGANLPNGARLRTPFLVRCCHGMPRL